MTLLEIVTEFEKIAKKIPNINYVGNGDIYELNNLPNIDYGVFYITQTNHTQNEDNTNYTLTLFYVDRLAADSSNKLAIQSNGIRILTNIINVFAMNNDVEISYDIQYTTFLQRFVDECAGVFCNITIKTNNDLGICGFEYN